jgi:hypothetical protein
MPISPTPQHRRIGIAQEVDRGGGRDEEAEEHDDADGLERGNHGENERSHEEEVEPIHTDALAHRDRGIEQREEERTLKSGEHRDDDEANAVDHPDIRVRETEDIAEQIVQERHAHLHEADQDNTDREGDGVEETERSVFLQPRTAREQLCAQGNDECGDERTEEQSHRGKAEEDDADRQSWQQGVRQRVGHEGQPPQHNESAKKAVGEADEGAANKDAAHEFVLKGFGEPVHGGDQ